MVPEIFEKYFPNLKKVLLKKYKGELADLQEKIETNSLRFSVHDNINKYLNTAPDGKLSLDAKNQITASVKSTVKASPYAGEIDDFQPKDINNTGSNKINIGMYNLLITANVFIIYLFSIFDSLCLNNP